MILEKVSFIFVLIILGFVYCRITKGTQSDTNTLSKLVLNVSVPASIISSITSANYEAVKEDLPVLLLAATAISAVTLAVSFVLPPLLRVKTRAASAVYQSALFFNNYGFMGWPVCQLLFGDQGMLYAALYSIPLHLLFYTITPAMLNRGGNGKLFDRKVLVNLPLYATIIGLMILMLRLQLPDYVAQLCSVVGATQTPLSMMIVGMILASANLKEIIVGVRPYLFSLLRLLVLPAAVYLVLESLGLSGLLLGVPVMITAMPTGAMVVVLAQKYRADTLLTSRLIIISTLLSILTVPIIAMLVL